MGRQTTARLCAAGRENVKVVPTTEIARPPGPDPWYGSTVPDTHNARGRAVTDQSLGDERRKTDDELAHRRADIEDDADAVVARARARADEVLRVAREAADLRSSGSSEQSDQLTTERHRDDLRALRSVADEDAKRPGARSL